MRKLAVEPLESRRLLSAFSVTNVDDSGPGSLRAAIESANADPGTDTIEFADGLFASIPLASQLPTITDDLEIVGPDEQQLIVDGQDEAAEALGISLATAQRYRTYARAWLFAEINPEELCGLGRFPV